LRQSHRPWSWNRRSASFRGAKGDSHRQKPDDSFIVPIQSRRPAFVRAPSALRPRLSCMAEPGRKLVSPLAPRKAQVAAEPSAVELEPAQRVLSRSERRLSPTKTGRFFHRSHSVPPSCICQSPISLAAAIVMHGRARPQVSVAFRSAKGPSSDSTRGTREPPAATQRHSFRGSCPGIN
jgi:hypothetical protein